MNTTNMTRGKKVNAEILKFSAHKPGFTFRGKLLGRSEKPWVDKDDGEEKIIPVFHFENETHERINVFGDAGLVNAISGANIQEGQWIEIEKGEQHDLGGGKRVNQYNIYELT